MKKLLCCVIIICTLISVSGCQYALERKKNQYFEIYEIEENFVSLTGEVLEVEYNGMQLVKIKCDELLEYVTEKEYERIHYKVLCDSPLNLEVGDTITFVTVPEHRKYSYCIPIVFVSKDGETLLELEEGKENLIEWVNQLGLK